MDGAGLRRLSLFLIILLVFSTIIALTRTDINNYLTDDSLLSGAIGSINSMLGSIPSQLRGIIGTDRVYHVRISSYELGVVLRSGLVSSISRGRPSNPTHIAYTDIDTIVAITSSSNPANAVLNAVLGGNIIITEAPQCTSDEACADNQVCENNQCVDAFTIAVVPIGYGAGEFNDFYDKARPEIDLFEQYAPIGNGLIRVHYVSPSVCPNNACTDVCRDCQNTALACANSAGLAGVADKVAAVHKDDVYLYINGQPMIVCGCAGGIPAYTSVSRARLYADGGVYCYMTVPHEMGHQLGLYHVDATGTEAGACLGPNAADCGESDKASDIMGYAWPQDHYGPAATNYMINNPLSDYQ